MVIWFWVSILLLFLLFVSLSMDPWFFMRLGLHCVHPFFLKANKDVFRVHIVHGVVLPSDLDFMGHMNNARYLREADIARTMLLVRFKACQVIKHFKAKIAMSACCSRFRRSLNVFEKYDIHTRILGWDDHSFYIEQLFLKPHTGFVIAVVLCRYYVSTAPAKVMEYIAGKKVESPELPEDVLHWLKYNEASSQRIRSMTESQDNGKLQ